uniref:NADH dehydrogenase subunit 2 n=1 Tax=Eteoneus sigillatus TaxID=1964414 RepID=UPI0030039FD1|nr:NADH dehydrogenase subunit 2 [Eteoneus sigillatus]
MYKMNKKKLFLFLMIISSMMVVSSTSWLSMWVGMEINLMMNIPFLFTNKSKEMSEKIMIYFLIQVMGSTLMLTVITTKNFCLEYKNLMNLILSMSMMIKLGIPPFHLWMPEMLNKLNWNIMMVMMTLQKINPLVMMVQLMSQNSIMPTIMITSASLGSIMGMNQLSLNKLMAFSSMNHMSWIMMSSFMMNNMWIKYFIIYSLINYSLCYTLNKMNVFYMNQMSTNTDMKTKIMFSLMMMNLGGFPPMPGFMLKWMVMEWMANSGFMTIMTIMLASSMITLVFYLRMMYMNTMVSSLNFKFKMIKMNKNMFLMFIMNMVMPMMILI